MRLDYESYRERNRCCLIFNDSFLMGLADIHHHEHGHASASGHGHGLACRVLTCLGTLQIDLSGCSKLGILRKATTE